MHNISQNKAKKNSWYIEHERQTESVRNWWKRKLENFCHFKNTDTYCNQLIRLTATKKESDWILSISIFLLNKISTFVLTQCVCLCVDLTHTHARSIFVRFRRVRAILVIGICEYVNGVFFRARTKWEHETNANQVKTECKRAWAWNSREKHNAEIESEKGVRQSVQVCEWTW